MPRPDKKGIIKTFKTHQLFSMNENKEYNDLQDYGNSKLLNIMYEKKLIDLLNSISGPKVFF